LATEDPDQMRVVTNTEFEPPCTPQWRANEGLARHSGAQERSGAQENGPEFDEVARLSTEAEVRTDSTDPADQARHSGAQRDGDLPAFLDWLVTTYPLHNQGAQPVVHPERDGAVVQSLFDAGFALQQLQAMTIAMWTITTDGDPTSHRSWIARSDRSLRVLRHKAQFLSRAVAGVAEVQQQALFGPLEVRPLSQREIEEAKQIRWARGGCYHDPGHTTFAECVRAIALSRRAG
jgi:hypothetical protein